MIALYNLALVAAFPLAALALLFSPRARLGVTERLRPLPQSAQPRIWVHAASVGEAEAAAPLIERLLARGLPLVATTLTLTGRDRLRQRFPTLGARLAPLDLWPLARRSVRRARVAVLVLVETELWPSQISAVAAAGGEVVVASARLSERSFPRYRWARFLFRPVLARVAVVAAQSETDAERFRALGFPAERCSVEGDLKLDRAPSEPAGEGLREALGAGPFLLGGSTHPGEEEALLAAWQQLRAGGAHGLRLLLVPRHPERVEAVVGIARRAGASVGLRTQGAAAADVVVVDSVGELGSIYGLAELVFSGGTLAPVGGHNLVEPVQVGRVVVHGPHTWNQRAHERLLQPLGVLHRVESAEELGPALARLWCKSDRNAPALAARAALASHRGAADRILELVVDAYARVNARA